ncbi:MAG TPA: hypothetical protein DHU56_00900 [Marinobacter sp.]|nr:hypothetical protein [Marinobacter sp.]
MQTIRTNLRLTAFFMAILMGFSGIWASTAAAGVVGTGELLSEQRVELDRASLLSMLEQEDVKNQLAAMGVSQADVEKRIQNLTPAELSAFEQQLAEAPVGQNSVVGIIVLFLLVFVITDMLCATNIYSFVNCVR